MAEGCGDGVLENETFNSLRITDDNCTIISSTIKGNLTLINPRNVLLLNNKVGGKILVDGNAGLGTANVIANTVFGGDIIVKELSQANVIENETLTGDIRVNQNGKALVQKNISANDLICRSNTGNDAFLNVAAKEEDCENTP